MCKKEYYIELAEIKASKKWAKDGYPTWKSYCENKLHMTVSGANFAIKKALTGQYTHRGVTPVKGIYAWKNRTLKQIYIGQSCDCWNRKLDHEAYLSWGRNDIKEWEFVILKEVSGDAKNRYYEESKMKNRYRELGWKVLYGGG